jgi:electron transfer flavoprotein beta subunit
MKILVTCKRCIDYNVKVKVKADGSDVDLANVKMSLNPFDEIAVEEALRLKEAGIASEVIVATIGVAKADDVLRTALAMGADSGIHIQTDSVIEPLVAAQLFAAIVKEETPSLIIMGKQAIDDDSNQTGQMLAALLGFPQATFASKVVVQGGEAHVTREVDGGLITIAIKMPCVITTDLRLNQPRYVALPNIMKARSKPVAKKTPEDYGITPSQRLKTIKVSEPAKRKGGIKVASVDALIDKLKNEASVL